MASHNETGFSHHRNLAAIPRYSWVIYAILFPLILGGCVTLKDPEASQEYNADVIAIVDPDTSFGQSFVSRRPGLNAIELWLYVTPDAPQDGSLEFALYHSITDNNPLVRHLIPINAIGHRNPLSINFTTQTDPAEESYYLSLSTNSAQVQVLGRAEDAYPHGDAFLNSLPINADAAFRLAYDYNVSGVLNDLKRFLSGIWISIPLMLTLIIPGWLILNLSRFKKSFDGGEQIAISLGLSMAIIPLAMSWTSFFELSWTRNLVLITGVILSGVTLWTLFRDSTILRKPVISWHSLALGVIFIFSLMVRLIMVRDLAAPPWVDSVHHGTLTRLIQETGGFPQTYHPYLDIDSANYHSGYHGLLVSFQWLSNQDLEVAMLVFAQVLNALAIFSVYLFTTTILKDRTAGLVAALITGLISPMPAYYTSWGRYTQLAGLLILPVAIAWILRLVEARTHFAIRNRNLAQQSPTENIQAIPFRLYLLASLTAAGLFLTHYRVALFLGCYLLADFVCSVWPNIRTSANRKYLIHYIQVVLVVGTFSALLILPWLPVTLQTLIVPRIGSTPQDTSIPFFSDFNWSFLTTALGSLALILASLGMLWGLLHRQRFVFVFILWISFLFFLANLNAMELPGGGFLNNLSVEIALFIPISALGGYFTSQIITEWAKILPERILRPYYIALSVAGIVMAFVAARQLLPILNPITFLFRQADRPSLNWIDEHVPRGETILINPFAWGYGLYAGNDGGYWITPLIGRNMLPPPVLYGLDNRKEQIQSTNQISQQIIESGRDPEQLFQLMQREGIHYVYLGVKGGPISAKALLESPLFEQLYSNEGTYVFQLNSDH